MSCSTNPVVPSFNAEAEGVKPDDIIRRLTDPACRLMTLIGPGGIGKTRLAIQAAQTLAEGWSGEAAIADGADVRVEER